MGAPRFLHRRTLRLFAHYSRYLCRPHSVLPRVVCTAAKRHFGSLACPHRLYCNREFVRPRMHGDSRHSQRIVRRDSRRRSGRRS